MKAHKPHQPRTASNDKNDPSKRKSKRWKIAGSTLLLAAFGLQMYQISAAAIQTDKVRAAELDARSHLKGLGYENLYFSIKTATGEDDPFNLFAAAAQRTVGRVAMIATSGQPKDVMTARITAITQASRAVRDLPTFNSFMHTLQAQIDESRTDEVDNLIANGRFANKMWYIYITLFILGSFCVIRSQVLE